MELSLFLAISYAGLFFIIVFLCREEDGP